MNKPKFLATLMITLILSLPFYTANVFADTPSIDVTVKGSGGIEDYVMKEDFVNFEADVFIEGDDDIDAGQVIFGTNNPFDSCSLAIEGFTCRKRFPATGTDEFDEAQPYTINLKNDDGDTVKSISGRFYPDFLAPVLSSFSFLNSDAKRTSVSFSYSAKDYAYDDTISGACSGIDSLRLYNNEGYSQTFDLDVDVGICSITESLNNKELIGISDGDHTIYATVTDKFGQVSQPISAELTIDSTAPAILSSTFMMTDSDSYGELDYVNTKGVDVIFSVEVDEDNTVSVTGDFSGIGKESSSPASCTRDSGNYICKWTINDFSVSATDSLTKTFTITAKDSIGNEAEIEVAKTFELDQTAPEVLSIATGKIIGGNSYAKSTGNSFTAEFNEAGSGFNPSQVLLIVGDGSSNSGIEAKSCDGSSCSWEDVSISTSAGSVAVSISTTTTDRVGNAVASAFTETILMDNEPPELVYREDGTTPHITITNAGQETEGVEGHFTEGDYVVIVALVKDDSFSTAYADLSDVIAGSDNVEADDCVLNDEDAGNLFYECGWDVGPIDVSEYLEAEIDLKFEDAVGNVMEHTEEIIVYETIEGEADYWTINNDEIACSPSKIDRETTTLINQKVYCAVQLNENEGNLGNPQIITISLDECDTTSITNFSISNNQQGSTSPYIELNLNQDSYEVDQLDIVCNLSVYTKSGNKITRTPEAESVALSLTFYNYPLGEISEGTQDKIDEAVERAMDALPGLIGGLSKIVFYGKQLCSIRAVILNFITMLEMITEGLMGASTNAQGTYAYPGLKAVTLGTCQGEQAARKQFIEGVDEEYLKPMCDFVNCKQYYFWAKKWNSEAKTEIQKNQNENPDWKGLSKPASQYIDPKKSIIGAIAFGCLPGIIAGLERLRQIECIYALCLKTNVAEDGISIAVCEEQRAYAKCMYVYGEFFYAFPYTALLDKWMKMVRASLTSPLSVLMTGVSVYCHSTCFPDDNAAGYKACEWTILFSLIGEILGDYERLAQTEDWGKDVQDQCAYLEELVEEEE